MKVLGKPLLLCSPLLVPMAIGVNLRAMSLYVTPTPNPSPQGGGGPGGVCCLELPAGPEARAHAMVRP